MRKEVQLVSSCRGNIPSAYGPSTLPKHPIQSYFTFPKPTQVARWAVCIPRPILQFLSISSFRRVRRRSAATTLDGYAYAGAGSVWCSSIPSPFCTLVSNSKLPAHTHSSTREHSEAEGVVLGW